MGWSHGCTLILGMAETRGLGERAQGLGRILGGSGTRSGLGLHSLSDVSPVPCPAFPPPAFPPAVFMQRKEASLGDFFLPLEGAPELWLKW